MTPRHGHPVRRSISRTPFAEQGRIAPELVDREARDHRRVAGVEYRPRPHHRGDHAPAVDVGEQADRNLRAAGEPHVRDVALAQVRLRRASRALDDHQVEGVGEPLEAFHHRRDQPGAACEEIPRLQGRGRASVHHHLRSAVGLGFEQHRVHVHRRRKPGGAGLERLRTADLAAAGTRRSVVRHVLGLERRHPESTPPRQPAQPGHDHGLADVRAGTLDHQRPAFHAVPPTRPPPARIPPMIGSAPIPPPPSSEAARRRSLVSERAARQARIRSGSAGPVLMIGP